MHFKSITLLIILILKFSISSKAQYFFEEFNFSKKGINKIVIEIKKNNNILKTIITDTVISNVLDEISRVNYYKNYFEIENNYERKINDSIVISCNSVKLSNDTLNELKFDTINLNNYFSIWKTHGNYNSRYYFGPNRILSQIVDSFINEPSPQIRIRTYEGKNKYTNDSILFIERNKLRFKNFIDFHYDSDRKNLLSKVIKSYTNDTLNQMEIFFYLRKNKNKEVNYIKYTFNYNKFGYEDIVSKTLFYYKNDILSKEEYTTENGENVIINYTSKKLGTTLFLKGENSPTNAGLGVRN